jgi:hypothetical protein
MFAAPVSADSGITSPMAPLGESDETAYGIDWMPTREYVANTANHLTIPASAISKPPEVVADLSFLQLPRVDEIGGTARWTYEHDTDINGIAYWFDLELSTGEWISNAPGVSPGSWAQLLLPLDPPVHVPGGESLSVGVKPEPLRDGAPGWLSWWASAGGVEVRGHEFASSPTSFADLYHESPDAIPRLSEKGLFEARVLQLVDGKRSVFQLAAELTDTLNNVGESEAVRRILGALKDRVERPELSDFRSP